MSVINATPMLLGGEGYEISRSVRTRKSATGYFSRTPASASNRKTWTLSKWVKFGDVSGSIQSMFGTMTTSNYTVIGINSAGQGSASLTFESISGTTTIIGRGWTNAVYRDPSAWYHIVFALDTTQAVSTDRVKIYVNGVLQSLSSYTAPAQNSDHYVNQASVSHALMGGYSTGYTTDGYLTEVNFIDGQALTPSSFGETDSITGVWKPKKYAGTYGTNGFYLNFSDPSAATAAAIGKDNSGNGNNWTPNNISVTSGVTYDSMIDVPTMYADGGNGRGNYAVLNAVSGYSGLPLTAANIQTSAVPSGGNWYSRSATMGISSGKWYAEFTMPSITSGAQGNPAGIGIIPASNDFSAAGQLVGDTSRGYGFYCPDTTGGAPVRRVSSSNTSVGTGTATSTSDVFMVAFDLTSGTAWFGKNGTWYAGDPSAGTGASITGITSAEYVFAVSIYRDTTFTNNTVAFNFGQRPFAYTPPTGFKALNTQNLPDSTIKKGNQWFDATTYTGNGGTQSIVNSGAMQPDLVWGKARSLANSNWLMDSVRGTGVFLSSDQTIADTATSTILTSYNSNGFTVGVSNSSNQNAATYVGWQWKAGGTAVSNTSGTITSSVSANTSAGFSVVTYTGTGTNGATVGHGLGAAPKMIIVKARNASATDWPVYHGSIGNTGALLLNTTNQTSTSSLWWNNTSPSSSVFTLGTIAASNTNTQTQVAYLFAEVAGYSKFGSYTGNGSTDGPFVYLGFRPKFVMMKRTDAAGFDWFIYDSSRDAFNVTQNNLRPNTSGAESAQVANYIDLTSNGFKLRGDNTGSTNNTSGTYIYAAFAENPFKNSLAR